MPDTYLNLVNTGITQELAKKLGLPRPSVLRRFNASKPLVPGPVLLLGEGDSANHLSEAMLGWNLDVRRHMAPGQKLGAIIIAWDSLSTPGELSDAALMAGPALKDLLTGGRFITISRPAVDGDSPETAAARQGVDGFLRSVAHEMRGGGTANGILLAGNVTTAAPSLIASLRFLLSGRSAYVSGQFLEVSSNSGDFPANWNQPLAGKVAVVTGAARGIGAAIAKVLKRDGAQLIVVDVPPAGEQLAKVANQLGGTALQLDITADDAGERILEHALSRYGRLDIVVHNAGITRDKLLANMDETKWKSVLAVNIESQLHMNRQLLDNGNFGRNGRIISLASTSGIAGNRGQSNYATSKAGVIGMVRATAPAIGKLGGSINAVAPGFIETEMTAKIPFLTRQVARRLSSLQQGGLPIDVAETISFLASDAAAGVNGEVIRVCGQNLVGA
ncbi:3-oxoacyl-ACP reductase [Arthrobacter roseus]|uniref:3-oxoacyl-ACP reductase n=1 Tax=Arthrobacter roseus TaxID=136274 RepID=UPI001965020F|nr:3-oxoacyl-ACP reductase [Arthrobacter roseus]MBM7848534.1 3-oxoacyl-[acyl-carrier protein] reductase [Arthrobacter roseus]